MARPSNRLSSSVLTLLLAAAVLVVGGVGVTVAATGGTFLLGTSNSANRTTSLSNTGQGAALKLKTSSAGTPNLAVSNKARIPNLNADLLDGVNGAALQRRISGGCAMGIAAVSPSGGAACAKGLARFGVPGEHVYSIPAKATYVLVRIWGAGGGGGYPISWAGSSGGGQGGYVEALVPVTPGQQLTATVGAGGNGGGIVGNACCFPGTDGGASTLSIASVVVATAPGGLAGSTANSCPNSGIAGGGGGGTGSVTSPALGLTTTAGADGGSGHSSAGCGGGDGAAGTGGGSGFAGAGGSGKSATGNVINGDNGSNGLVMIMVIG